MSRLVKDRIRNNKLFKKITSAEEAAMFIKDGMTVATSGFTPSGYPKAVPLALAERVKNTGANIGITLITGASVGEELDGELSKCGVIKKRLPYQTQKDCRDRINLGDIHFVDMHLSHLPQYIKYGFLGHIDIAIIEAVAITEEGYIVPSTSVGNTPTIVEKAEKVIIEINTSQPLDLEGMHDIYIPQSPPNRLPIPITKASDRIGTNYVPIDIDKIVCIVITDIKDNVRPLAEVNDVSKKMAENLIGFLEDEIKFGRIPKELLPLQSGVGSVANAVLKGLLNSKFDNIQFYTEVIQDSVIDLIDADKVEIASGTSITPSKEGLVRFYNNIDRYKSKIILRPQEISNNPEVIRRLGIIALNTAIEVDIYGNVNSTNIMGSRMMNGIGGSGDFTRNAYISVFTTQSIARNGDISTVVPMVAHHDHTEHDVDVIITEQGIADLRGLSPKEKAEVIIKNCAHPDYKEALKDYYKRAKKIKYNHTPVILDEALSWHK
ncbi:acetyl-CoA hydrolase/transferase family protein, partial [Caldisalinibacter kiritimatiensis]|uniref:acetyl-CoA hydrolase/transferase family protein n=1 Tax=Caldisalinibacter kiritimatiensis TaxID=1304284 RepID=UPI003BF9B22A